MKLEVALFDLDNTLYPASSGLMQMVDSRINAFVQEQLGLSEEEASNLRRRYFQTYGTTLRGLQQHHTVDPEHYLQYVHDIALEQYVASDAELDHLLEELPLRKVIFSNAPTEHAERVLRVMGLQRHFEAVFDIRSFNFYAKPDPQAYGYVLQQLGVQGRACLMIEDTLPNLKPARELGLTTVLVSQQAVVRGRRRNGQPLPADYVVPDVLAAIRLAIRLAGTARQDPAAVGKL